MWFTVLIITLGIIWVLAYHEIGAMVWLSIMVAGLLLATLIMDINGYLAAPFWLLIASAALLLGVPHIRRRYLTLPLLLRFRKVMPAMSQTEKEALEAGTVWWDAELFSGRPNWNSLLNTPAVQLSPQEQGFLDGPVETLCRMLDDWQITQHDHDLSREVWQFIRQNKFFGMIIPEQYGGLGFSAYAHSQVVIKLASRSITAAVTVMVPNSLGPVATLIGLAFKLFDPDHLLGEQEDRGISLALIPRDTAGISIGKRHITLDLPFQNGPNQGRNVFIPLTQLVGGKQYIDDEQPQEDWPLVHWACEQSLYRMQESLRLLLRNLPSRSLSRLLRIILFPVGYPYTEPDDRMGKAAAKILLTPSATRDRLTQGIFISLDEKYRQGVMEKAFLQAAKVAPLENTLRRAHRAGVIRSRGLMLQAQEALDQSLLTRPEFNDLEAMETLRSRVISVDAFERYGKQFVLENGVTEREFRNSNQPMTSEALPAE